MNTKSKKSGYTLLFAVLISVLVLGIAVFISGIARKQYILSSTALDSMYAFYAADSGVECAAAAYNSGAMSTTTGGSMLCNGTSYPVAFSSYTYATMPANITIPASFTGTSQNIFLSGPSYLSLGGGTCADLRIFDGYDSSNSHITIIESRGYNICDSSHKADGSSPRTVERALQVHYY